MPVLLKMHISIRAFALGTLLSVSVGFANESGDDAFHTRIRPLLERACIKCHGAEKQKGALRLDSLEAALAGGDTGPALVPGKPGESLLIQLIRHTDPDRDRMPPKETLDKAEIAELERWVAAGAPWPPMPRGPTAAGSAAGERVGDAWSDPRNPIVRIFGGRRLDLWSLKPPAQSSRKAIDDFGAAPAPQADRRTLIRRLTFGLIGLPPTPEEVADFVNDPSSDAWPRLVERLLASPRYGEHWARMWLDVVRYSDSNGFDWDEFRPEAWRFRDYVVRSFNADKPWDRFVREQLAGDEMLPGAPRDRAEQDALIATGFLRLGPWDNSAALFGEQAKVRQQLLGDLVETAGSAFLGLTMSCCRCHDHKYDPISHADYYRLRAFFEGVKPADDLPLDLAEEQAGALAGNAEREERLAKARAMRAAALTPAKARLAAQGKTDPSEDEARAALTHDEKALHEKADALVQSIKAEKKAGTMGLLMVDAEGEPSPTHVLGGGNLADPRETVVPGFLSVLDPNPASINPPPSGRGTGRRTALADWIVSERNPLTARVLVNRIWQGHFGEGLVSTANDFGLAGAPPRDVALLDWLAQEFIRKGWSVKGLHRTIVSTATYRAAVPARRLAAEQLRDSMLAVAGRMVPKEGGPAVWPPLPQEVLKANPAVLDDNKEKTKGWYPSPAELQGARSLFLVQKRNLRVPLMEAFDLPENAVSCARRSVSTVAPQALTLLNSEFVADIANGFAERLQREAGPGVNDQVERGFTLALQRGPDEAERTASIKFCEERSLAEFCRVMLNVNEFAYVD